MSEAREREAMVAAELAHEIRNVFAILEVSIAFLREVVAEHEEARIALEDLRLASGRAARIATRLLEISQQVADDEGPAELGAVITQHGAAMRRLAPSGVRVELEPSDEALRVAMSSGDLDQVLFNLVLNAIDAMARDGGVLTIRTRRLPLIGRPGFAELRVTDTGVGMDEATLQRCFEPFFTTKGGRGTGIGLHAVRDAAERAGGRITIESAAGRGTAVCLYLPLVDDAP